MACQLIKTASTLVEYNRWATTFILDQNWIQAMNPAFIYLTIAIISEVIATSALKASEEFTRLIPSLVVVIGYGAAFDFLALVLRTIPVGLAYAIWSGMGIVLVTIIGIILYKQIPDTAALIGMALIISGVIVINLFSKTINH